MLAGVLIPRCYFSKQTSTLLTTEIHAFAAAVYLRLSDSAIGVQTTLVISKTKVAPIKKRTIPRFELCGAYMLARLLRQVLNIPLSNVHAWTDSTIVLNWLDGNPRRLKTYVGNRISSIIDFIPPDKWKHVRSAERPADCASRGLYPSELIDHQLWWNGPSWLRQSSEFWPKQTELVSENSVEESCETTLNAVEVKPSPVIDPSRFNYLKRITAWIMRFVRKCRGESSQGSVLTAELKRAET